MTRTAATIVLGTLVAGVALSSGGQPRPNAFAELHRERLESGDLEVVMGLITRDGESETPKHIHPHGEMGFVLEGSITVRSEISPDAQVTAGSSFYQPPGQWHVVSTSGEGAKTLVFRVVEPGLPMVTEVE